LKRGMKYPDGSTSPGRCFMLKLYANFLRGSGLDQAATVTALRYMAANMKPPYPSDPPDQDPPLINLCPMNTQHAPGGAGKTTRSVSGSGISADVIQANDLDLQTIRPADVARAAYQARPLQADMIQERRYFARNYIEKNGPRSARRLANVYRQNGFTGANHETANQDLHALGFVSVSIRPRGGRPRRKV